MKKAICFLLICLNVFSESYTITQLLDLYEKTSYNSKEKEVQEKQQVLKKKAIVRGNLDKFTLEINPNIVREEKENIYVNNFNFSYKNFYYKITFDEEREKISENIGYSTSIMDGFFQEKIDKRIALENLNIEKIKEEKNFREKKKKFIENIFSYLVMEKNIENNEELLNESLVEEEILARKEKLGESNDLDILTNQNEVLFYKNNLTFFRKEKENLYKQIKQTLKIIGDFRIEKEENFFFLKGDISDMELLKSNLIILENKIKKEKMKQFENINISYNYDKLKKSHTGSLSYIFIPFENKSDMKLFILEKEKILINQNEVEEQTNKTLEDIENKYNYLKSEFERNKSYFEKYQRYYEIYKEKFEEKKISYKDYLKIKKDFIEIKKCYDNSYFEFEKFKYLNI